MNLKLNRRHFHLISNQSSNYGFNNLFRVFNLEDYYCIFSHNCLSFRKLQIIHLKSPLNVEQFIHLQVLKNLNFFIFYFS